MASRTVAREIERIAEKVTGYASGVVAVLAAEGEPSTDREGDAVLRFTLRVSDPPAGSGTWPLEDVQAVRRYVQSLVAEADDDLPYALVELRPDSPDLPDESEGTDKDLANALDQE